MPGNLIAKSLHGERRSSRKGIAATQKARWKKFRLVKK
jgi:hypothetical protein